MSNQKVSIIILTGRKGSGKDEAARYLIHKYPERHPVKVAYADCLKDVAMDLMTSFYGSSLPVKREDLDDPDKKEAIISGYIFQDQPLTIRRVLQVVGTDILRRRLGFHLWIDQVFQKIRQLPPSTNLIILSDCRFADEIAELSRRLEQATQSHVNAPTYRLTSIRILRPAPGATRPNGSADFHTSEIQEFPVDMTLNNDGTLEQFYKQLDRITIQ